MAENKQNSFFNIRFNAEGVDQVKKAFASIAEVSAKTSKSVISGFKSIIEGVKGIADKIFSLKSAFLGFATFEGFKLLSEHTLEAIDHIGKLSQELGISTKDLGTLQLASDLAGTSIDELAQSTVLLGKNVQAFITTGSGPAADSFKSLGISVDDLKGKSSDSFEVLKLVADKIAELPDGLEKSTIATDLMSRAGAKMIPLLNGGSKEFDNLAKEAKKSGISLDEFAVKGVESANDALTRLKSGFQGLVNQITVKVAPYLERFFDFLRGKLESFIESKGGIENFSESIVNSLKGFVIDFATILDTIFFKLNETFNSLQINFTKLINALSHETVVPIFKNEEDKTTAMAKSLENYLLYFDKYQKLLNKKLDPSSRFYEYQKHQYEDELENAKTFLNKAYEDYEKITNGVVEKISNNHNLEKAIRTALSNTGDTAEEYGNFWAEYYKKWLKDKKYTEDKIANEKILMEKELLIKIDPNAALGESYATRSQMIDEGVTKLIISEQRGNELKLAAQQDYFDALESMEKKSISSRNKELIIKLDPNAALGESYANRSQMIDDAITRDIISEQRGSELKLAAQQDYFDALESMEVKSITSRTTYERASEATRAAFLLGSSAQILSNLSGHSKKLFEASKAVSIAEAIVSTYAGATKAYAQGGIYGFIGAAAIIAAGLANVAKIRSTTYGSTGGGGGGGGASSVSAIAPVGATLPSQNSNIGSGKNVTVNINGDVTGQDVIDKIKQGLKEALASDEILFNQNSAQYQLIKGNNYG